MRISGSKVPFAAATALAVAAVLVIQPIAGAQAPLPQAGGQKTETMIIVLGRSCTPTTGGGSGGTSASCTDQVPVLAQLQAAGATVLATTSLVDTITAQVTPSEAQALASYPGVSQVVPDSTISLAPPPTPVQQPSSSQVPPGAPGWRSHGGSSPTCGTQRHPELDPEALSIINDVGAQELGINGAGVTVATIADGVDPANPDFQRNPAYGPPGQPVVSQYDFSGEGTNVPTAGGEMFLDTSSIAAQGNTEYNLSQYVNPAQAARLPASGCWIKIVGAAPGANVMALKVFASTNDTTESGFIQAIQYAVQHGAKVINESFGANNVPDTTLDVTRQADDAAVAAGVTVVVSSGDAGSTSTIGSPATDPNLISVGGTTTLRLYAQADYGAFDNPAVGNGRWVDNNISALSSGGFSQAGQTLDLVAPGDLNWALCSTNPAMYTDCADTLGGTDIGVQLSGGTSESAPLTSAAAADVIQAYAASHGGADPAPALVKQILMSSATDINAPATEQGAGLLNVLGAVRLAESLPGQVEKHHHSPHLEGGTLVSPNQVNFVAAPNTPESQQISLTNTSGSPEHLDLSTRALTREVSDTGAQTFTMDPSSATGNSGTIQIWSGVTEVYQTETFTVPGTGHRVPSRLLFSSDYQFTGQSSLLHVALFAPDGTYAGYTLPQGLGDFEEAEVANPMPGTWTALFFTELNGATPGGVGTSGPIQWDAQTWLYAPAGSITPSHLNIDPGETATATLSLTTPSSAGDTGQSIVISSFEGQTTVPVTVRSVIPIGPTGGAFSGVLTGGNGRAGAPAQSNTYFFQVPPGQKDLDVSVALATDPGDALIAYLIDPNGQTVGYSSNYTLDSTFSTVTATPYTQLYHVAPVAGQWELVLAWLNPVTGNELAEPFTGAVQFNQVNVSSNLPNSTSTKVPTLTSTAYTVTVKNTGVAPEAFFVDPRLNNTTETLALPNQNSAVVAGGFTLPLPPGFSFPYYLVPTHTTQLQANVSSTDGKTPVTFDIEYFPGDPDLSPAVASSNVTSTNGAGSASLTFTEPEVSPGLWLLNPDELGPYPAGGAPSDNASATLAAVTEAFDPTVISSSGNLWDGSLSAPLYLSPGQSESIAVDITPIAKAGTAVSGTIYVDDFVLSSLYGLGLPNGDELAAIPYGYTTK